MSGILGLLHLDGGEIHRCDLVSMAAFLQKRGPEGTHLWTHGPVGLGHTRLSTTPEALREFLPLVHQPSGCVITADLRLDNRDELLSALGLRASDPDTDDAGLAMHAYLRWGTRCVERFLGDFAFAIWDPRRQHLFCARDHLGMKPFNYHHGPGKLFAFASSPVAVVAHEGVPYSVNMARVADALVPELEGVDTTSTFFEDVYRLPAAHAILVSPDGLRIWRYWTLDPDVELYRRGNESIEAFLDTFTKAVDARLRTVGPRTSMLSGGMDSNSIVAVARELLAERGEPPLMTISAISNDPACVESNAIRTVIAQGGINAHTIAVEELDDLMPEILDLTESQEEPFDQHMTMLRAIYVTARTLGAFSVLDGASGDVVLSEGAAIERLVRHRRYWTAATSARSLGKFWGTPGYLPAVAASAVRGFVPPAVLASIGPRHRRRGLRQRIESLQIEPAFATEVSLTDRLAMLMSHSPSPASRTSSAANRAALVRHPYLAVGRERYERVASTAGIDPRDPFADRRVLECSLKIPDELMIAEGWPKEVLRRAMVDRVPSPVCRRVGKTHLGWSFTVRRLAMGGRWIPDTEPPTLGHLDGLVVLSQLRESKVADRTASADTLDERHEVLRSVDSWLGRFSSRPRRVTTVEQEDELPGQ